MAFDYNNTDLIRPSSGGYVKWETPGDSVSGDVIEVRMGKNMNGDPVPELQVRDASGDDHTVTCSQAQLLNLVYENAPQAGDSITITFAKVEKRPNGHTLKHFDMAVVKGGAVGTVATQEEPF